MPSSRAPLPEPEHLQDAGAPRGGDKHQLNVRLPARTYAALAALGARRGVGPSTVARLVLAAYVAAHEEV